MHSIRFKRSAHRLRLAFRCVALLAIAFSICCVDQGSHFSWFLPQRSSTWQPMELFIVCVSIAAVASFSVVTLRSCDLTFLQDLKADNVVLSFDSSNRPRAKLIDLGLACLSGGAFEDANDAVRLAGVDQAAADQGSRAGLYKLFQHAPELQRAQSAFTSKADVWALGAMILHEMLYCCCGQLCVPGSAARTYNNTASPLAPRSNPLWTKSGVPFDPSYACISKALQIMYTRATADGCTPDDGETKLYEHLCNMNTRL
jgi:serine/threonine protein kinase